MSASTNKRRNRFIFWALIVGICLLIAGLCHLIDLKTIHAWGINTNGWLLFLLMSSLPLVGVPISILCVMAGAKFGSLEGLGITAVAVAINLIASWWMARGWLRKPLEKILQKTQYKIPALRKGEFVGVCLLIALVPGPSYTLKNYFLVMSKLPLKIIFSVGLPAHLFAMSPGILFGNFSGGMTIPKAAFLAAYILLLIGASQYLVHRIRARRQETHRSRAD